MRMAIPLAEALFTAWTAMLGKRVYVEDDMKVFNDKLGKLEDFMKSH